MKPQTAPRTVPFNGGETTASAARQPCRGPREDGDRAFAREARELHELLQRANHAYLAGRQFEGDVAWLMFKLKATRIAWAAGGMTATTYEKIVEDLRADVASLEAHLACLQDTLNLFHRDAGVNP